LKSIGHAEAKENIGRDRAAKRSAEPTVSKAEDDRGALATAGLSI